MPVWSLLISFCVLLCGPALAADYAELKVADYLPAKSYESLKSWFVSIEEKNKVIEAKKIANMALTECSYTTAAFLIGPEDQCLRQGRFVRMWLDMLQRHAVRKVDRLTLYRDTDELVSACAAGPMKAVEFAKLKRRMIRHLEAIKKPVETDLIEFAATPPVQFSEEYDDKVAAIRKEVAAPYAERFEQRRHDFLTTVPPARTVFIDAFSNGKKLAAAPKFWLDAVEKAMKNAISSFSGTGLEIPESASQTDFNTCSAEITRLHSRYDRYCKLFNSRMRPYFPVLWNTLKTARNALAADPVSQSDKESQATLDTLDTALPKFREAFQNKVDKTALRMGEAPFPIDSESAPASLQPRWLGPELKEYGIEGCLGAALPDRNAAPRSNTAIVACGVVGLKTGRQFGTERCESARITPVARTINRLLDVALSEEAIFFGPRPSSNNIDLNSCVKLDALSQLLPIAAQLTREKQIAETLSKEHVLADFNASKGILRIRLQ